MLVTCEHGGHSVPRELAARFAGAQTVLASHRGWDPGALPLARQVARLLGTSPPRAVTVTRLVVDTNRSAHHPRVFSEYTRGLPQARRRTLLTDRHAPHRDAVDSDVAEAVAGGARVLHLGVHTFTPVLDGVLRRADVALLYDPARVRERALCGAWARAMAVRLPDLAVRRNQPYRGASDGLTTWLRGRHPPEAYLGIEIEVNQRLLGPRGAFPERVGRALAGGLLEALAGLGWPTGAAATY